LILNAAWNSMPGKEAFKLRILRLTSPTGEPQKSPLAFVEHYHWGLASMIAGNLARRHKPFFDGFGLQMVIAEAMCPTPFGYGKSEWEVRGNITLASLLTGTLMVVSSL